MGLMIRGESEGVRCRSGSPNREGGGVEITSPPSFFAFWIHQAFDFWQKSNAFPVTLQPTSDSVP